MLKNYPAILLIVTFMSPYLWAGEVEMHWAADGEIDLDFGGTNFIDAFTKTGNLGGLLRDANIKATAEAEASASYKSKGEGYNLGIEAELSGSGIVEVSPTTSVFSVSNFDVSTEYQDRFRLVGNAAVPFGSINLNLKMEGQFSSVTAGGFGTPEASAKLSIKDTDSGTELFSTEYCRGDCFGNEGDDAVSALFSLSKLLGPNNDTDTKYRFEMSGRAHGAFGSAKLSVRFGNTLALDSITFPDGSTPEEHGFAIVFDSGLLSPNLDVTLSSADFNLNGGVDGSDFLRWQRGVGITSDALKIQGDADGNGEVNFADLLIWEAEYGSSVLPVSTSATVPEPSTATVLILGMALMKGGRRVFVSKLIR